MERDRCVMTVDQGDVEGTERRVAAGGMEEIQIAEVEGIRTAAGVECKGREGIVYRRGDVLLTQEGLRPAKMLIGLLADEELPWGGAEGEHNDLS
jgi:hypothetical protein